MKLNNKLFLLIAISLFLLISIGSVCATDNDSTDQVMQTIDESSNALSVENEIEDSDAILSADNSDETLLQSNSS